MSWHSAYEQVIPYVVRVETMNGFGTGFLFAYNKAHSVAALATASHVVQAAYEWRQPIKLWHPKSKETIYLESGDRVIWTDSAHDAATILIAGDALALPAEVLPLLVANKYKKVGVEVGWVGFPHLSPQAICFFSGRVSSRNSAQAYYLIDGVAINGVSGGPVFSDQNANPPQLIGVVSAYMANRRPGETLPGLLHVQDLTAFHDHIQKIKDMEDAREKELEAQQEDAQSGKPTQGSAPGDAPTS